MRLLIEIEYQGFEGNATDLIGADAEETAVADALASFVRSSAGGGAFNPTAFPDIIAKDVAVAVQRLE